MTDSDSLALEPAAAPSGNPTDVRKTKGIRFSDSGWEEVTAAPDRLGLPVAEIVRERILEVARDRTATDRSPIPTDVAALIEWAFHYVYMLATLRRDELTCDGRGDKKVRPVETAGLVVTLAGALPDESDQRRAQASRRG